MAPHTWTMASMPLEVENSGPDFHHDVCTAAFSKRVSAIKMLSVLLKAKLSKMLCGILFPQLVCSKKRTVVLRVF